MPSVSILYVDCSQPNSPTQAGEIFIVPEPEPVPDQVSNVQAHALLIQRGLLDQAQAAISAISNDTERQLAQLAFDRGTFVRNSPMVEGLGASLGLSSDQIDQMFRDAAKVLI